MADVQMVVRSVTDDDLLFWNRRGEMAKKVAMRGDHIGAINIEVVRCDRGPGDFRFCWRVPYVVPEGDGTTYWFSMFCERFPPVAAVVQFVPRATDARERSHDG